LRKEFVCVAVNNHNPATDGQKGAFLDSLKCPAGNWMHVATADGKVLFAGFGSDVEGDLKGALAKWRGLPEAERKPGAIKVPEPTDKTQAVIQPPAGGLVLRVYQRALKRAKDGELAVITKEDTKSRTLFPDESWSYCDAIYTQPMPDVMWLTEAEWKALVPDKPGMGDRFDVPAPIRMRLFKNHLINGTTSLPLWRWKIEDVKRGELTLTVEEVSPVLRLRLRGAAFMADNKDVAKAERGYDTKLTGILEYDPAKKAFTRLDFVSVGDWWGGEWERNRFARPGRTPFGVAFELATGDRASDFVPPNGIGFKGRASSYFAADKED
jgi:hypothetical protein